VRLRSSARARDLFLRTGGRNRNRRLPPSVSFYLGRNSIERLLPAEPLNVIYRGTLSATIPLPPLPPRRSSPSLVRPLGRFVAVARFFPPVSFFVVALQSSLSLSLSLSLLRLQIYKVGRVTTSSFVMKSGTFNILSRTEQADRPRPLAPFPSATFSWPTWWRIRTNVYIELMFVYDEWNFTCTRRM